MMMRWTRSGARAGVIVGAVVAVGLTGCAPEAGSGASGATSGPSVPSSSTLATPPATPTIPTTPVGPGASEPATLSSTGAGAPSSSAATTPSSSVTSTTPGHGVTSSPGAVGTGSGTATASATGTAPAPSVGSGDAGTSSVSGVPIYWVGESARSLRLYREFRTVPDVGGRVASAVAAMTRMSPLDPDYVNPWRPASRVSVRQSGSALTVDLSADALANRQVGSELAGRAVQQLVYTATAAAVPAQITTVTITVDGGAADAWGAVRLGAPVARAAQVEVLSHAWVISPAQGATVPAGRVTFGGYGTSFEANFLWTVSDSAGRVVSRDSATGGTGTGGFGEVSFAATLTPGAYTVELRTDDPSDGEGRGPMRDTKSFTVR